ncbi:MAG: signal peptidase II [Cyanobacteria bacterium SIG26]|nr:signal peptidase II [Cyanobacteria bacterium SIG26]
MNTTIGKYLYFIVCFAFWMFLALFSSKLIVDNLTSGHHYSNVVFNLHYLKNSGAAFSLLQNGREFLIIVAIAATTLLFNYVHHHIRSIHLVSLSFVALLSAGIMSNCHERIVLGFVRDYIQLNFINFPIFNVADIFITIGGVALVCILLFYKGR